MSSAAAGRSEAGSCAEDVTNSAVPNQGGEDLTDSTNPSQGGDLSSAQSAGPSSYFMLQPASS